MKAAQSFTGRGVIYVNLQAAWSFEITALKRMKRFATIVCVLWFVALGSTGLALGDSLKPNSVFFLIDDLGWGDVGFNGSKDMRTPNIDKLAYQGAILDAHYVQPVCSPTRSALMTGRYPTRTGVYEIVRPHSTWGLPLQERTLATASF